MHNVMVHEPLGQNSNTSSLVALNTVRRKPRHVASDGRGEGGQARLWPLRARCAHAGAGALAQRGELHRARSERGQLRQREEPRVSHQCRLQVLKILTKAQQESKQLTRAHALWRQVRLHSMGAGHA
eukprot:3712512-Pleurochrysis_carterae.AAC.2